jgi:membrane-associated phospholipid phosphatase
MLLNPPPFDIWFMARLVRLVGRHPQFDIGIRSAIRHNVLGGFWYAAAIFILWVRGTSRGRQDARRRVLTTLLATGVAILLTILAGHLVSWLPPSRHPLLAGLYPAYFGSNPNTNSFPSQSTALYSAVAAGIYSLDAFLGSILWVGVPTLVALPRVYVGGHYPTDVVTGLVIGIAGYLLARYLLEGRLVAPIERFFEGGGRLRMLWELIVFGWISQIAVEFRDVVWLKNSLHYFTQ